MAMSASGRRDEMFCGFVGTEPLSMRLLEHQLPVAVEHWILLQLPDIHSCPEIGVLFIKGGAYFLLVIVHVGVIGFKGTAYYRLWTASTGVHCIMAAFSGTF